MNGPIHAEEPEFADVTPEDFDREKMRAVFLEAWDAGQHPGATGTERSAGAFHYLVGRLLPREDWGAFR